MYSVYNNEASAHLLIAPRRHRRSQFVQRDDCEGAHALVSESQTKSNTIPLQCSYNCLYSRCQTTHARSTRRTQNVCATLHPSPSVSADINLKTDCVHSAFEASTIVGTLRMRCATYCAHNITYVNSATFLYKAIRNHTSSRKLVACCVRTQHRPPRLNVCAGVFMTTILSNKPFLEDCKANLLVLADEADHACTHAETAFNEPCLLEHACTPTCRRFPQYQS